jgi:hypothetical protein
MEHKEKTRDKAMYFLSTDFWKRIHNVQRLISLTSGVRETGISTWRRMKWIHISY